MKCQRCEGKGRVVSFAGSMRCPLCEGSGKTAMLAFDAGRGFYLTDDGLKALDGLVVAWADVEGKIRTAANAIGNVMLEVFEKYNLPTREPQ